MSAACGSVLDIEEPKAGEWQVRARRRGTAEREEAQFHALVAHVWANDWNPEGNRTYRLSR